MEEMAFWRVAAEDTDHLALVDPAGVERSAGQLLARCNQVSRGLAALGCGRGDTVAMVMKNEAEALSLYSSPLTSAVQASEDVLEGRRAFVEKRTPVWKGR